MKALIFGITGQDGSYLAELLLEKGYEVTGVTRRVSVDTSERIYHILPQINIIEGDVTDGFSVSKIIEEYEPDEIYNLAAQSHVATSFDQVHLTSDVTYSGLVNILESIRYSARKDEIRLYQASSSEMFGKNYTVSDNARLKMQNGKVATGTNGKGLYDYEKYQDENTAFMPQSPYAVAKLGAHNMVRIYREGYGIHGSCGILFNHESERRGEHFVTRKITKWIGEYQKLRQNSVKALSGINISADHKQNPDMIYRIQSNELKMFPRLRLGNLDAYRDWGHAKDYVHAMWLMLQQEEPDDYVIATGETHSVREFLDAAFAKIGINNWDGYVIIDPEFYRPAEVDYLLGKPDKAMSKLGWSPEISFKQLAERMVDHDVKKTGLRRPSLQVVPQRCSQKR
tara:strand:+ start:1130 stop:2323 length:1194 start_codon:yes stop_codon:yes gene_type:complete